MSSLCLSSAPAIPWSLRVLEGDARTQALNRLHHYHYRAGTPRSVEHVLGAVVRTPLHAPTRPHDGPPANLHEREEVIGILCVSRATLNAPWRAAAWPELFTPALTPARSAVLVNDFVRVISRVIIDPRYRGLGTASALVRAYLAHPLTPCTEALAGMSAASPFFASAGMRAVPRPLSMRDCALQRALLESRVPAWALCDAGNVRAIVRRRPALRAALRTWMRASKATRGRLMQPDTEHSDLLVEGAILAGAALTGSREVFVSP